MNSLKLVIVVRILDSIGTYTRQTANDALPLKINLVIKQCMNHCTIYNDLFNCVLNILKN